MKRALAAHPGGRGGSRHAGGASALARRASAWATSSEAPVRNTATGSVSLFPAAHTRTLAALAATEGVAVSLLTTKDRLAGRRVGRVALTVHAARDAWEALERPTDWHGPGVVGLPETARAPSQSRRLDDTARTRAAAVGLRLGDVALRHRAVRDGAGALLLPCVLGDADPALARLTEPPPGLVEDPP